MEAKVLSKRLSVGYKLHKWVVIRFSLTTLKCSDKSVDIERKLVRILLWKVAAVYLNTAVCASNLYH